jgi:hypothetical protein
VRALPLRRGTFGGLFGGGARGKTPPRDGHTPPRSDKPRGSVTPPRLSAYQPPPPPPRPAAAAPKAVSVAEDDEEDLDFAGDESDEEGEAKQDEEETEGEMKENNQKEDKDTAESTATESGALPASEEVGLTLEEAAAAQSEAADLWEEVQSGAVPLEEVNEVHSSGESSSETQGRGW